MIRPGLQGQALFLVVTVAVIDAAHGVVLVVEHLVLYQAVKAQLTQGRAHSAPQIMGGEMRNSLEATSPDGVVYGGASNRVVAAGRGENPSIRYADLAQFLNDVQCQPGFLRIG